MTRSAGETAAAAAANRQRASVQTTFDALIARVSNDDLARPFRALGEQALEDPLSSGS